MVTDTELEPSKARDVARLLALVEAERKYYQGVVASIPIGILIVSADLNVVSSNREIRKVLGVQGGESLPLVLEKLLPNSTISQIREVIRTGVPMSNVIATLSAEMPRSPAATIRLNVRQMRSWSDDRVVEALVTIEDADGLEKSTGSPAADSGIPAADLLDTLDAVIWAVEIPEKRFLYVNEKAQELLGYPADRWLDDAAFWSERIYPEDRAWVVSSYERAIDNTSRHTCEFRMTGSPGKIIWVRETARVLQDPEGRATHLIGSAIDVTQRRALEGQFVQSQRLAAADKIANRAAAEITNQVMLISGYTEEMLGALDANSPARADLREILNAAERLRALTSQLTAGQLTQLQFVQPVELGELMKSFEPSIRRKLGAARQVEIKVFPALIAVRVNPAQLEEILGIFATQAATGMADDGKLTIECSPSEVDEQMSRPSSMLHPGVYASITVEDNGATMDVDTRQGLFDSFLPPREGDGLGPELSRAYRLIRQLGGDISVSPRFPRGNAIQIFLPRIGEAPVPLPPPPQAVPEPQPAPLPESPLSVAPRPQTILVVESDASIRVLIRKMLRRQSYNVIESEHIDAAFTAGEKHVGKIDLVIADILLPAAASGETADRFRKTSPNVKLLYLTVENEESKAALTRLPPEIAILQKPFTLGSLIQRVRDLIG